MARCNHCRYHFRVMEDEQPDECPRCGWTGPQRYCPTCSRPLDMESGECFECYGAMPDDSDD